MAKGVSSRQFIRIGTESIASEPSAVRAGHSTSAATLGETRWYRVPAAPVEGWASASSETHASFRPGISKERAATWIRVLLQLEPELPLARLADELGFSNRQFGKALGLLIREGRARVRDAAGGLRVVHVKATRQGTPPMPQERR
jgi:hypothetical protein